MRKLIKIIIFSVILVTNLSFKNVNSQNSSIIGTWLSEKDSNWKLVFTSSNCYQYYNNILIETNTYSISNTTPQCGKVVPITNYTSYLKLTEVNNTSNFTCYEINGITSQYLSLRQIDKGVILLFIKQ